MFRSVSSKISILLISIFLLLLSGSLIMLIVNRNNLARVNEEATLESNSALKNVINLKSVNIQSYIADYSLWDEMVNFLRTQNSDWARINLHNTMSFYHVSWVIATDTSFQIVFNSRDEAIQNVKADFPTAQDLRRVLKNDKVNHFYIKCSDKIVEFFGSAIRESKDTSRTSEHFGWLLAGRLWDSEYIGTVAELTGGNVEVVMDGQKSITQIEDNTIIGSMILTDWNEKPIASIISINKSAVVEEFKRNFTVSVILISLFSILILLTLIIFLKKYVTKPLTSINKILEKRDPDLLAVFQDHSTEFTELKKTIHEFFDQETLIDEIERRKSAESRLLIAEERYKLLVESVPEIFWITNLDGKIEYISPKVYDLLGYKAEEFLQSDNLWFQLVHPEDLPDVLGHFKLFLNKEKPYEIEYRIYKKDGVSIWIIEKAVSRFVQDGVVYGCGSVMNITDKRRMIEELAKERKNLFLLMDNIPDQVFFKDSTLRYINVNQAFIEHNGFKDIDEVVGKSDFDIFPDEVATHSFKIENQILQTGQSLINDEIEVKIPGQLSQWFLTSKVPIKNSSGHIIGLVGITRDISLRKETEFKIQDFAKELSETNASKDKFFSIMAHDLKNPFNAILGFSSVLMEEYDEYTNEERKQFIRNIFEASETTYKLIQNMLEWSRAQTGRIDYQPEFINISVLVNESVKLHKPTADAKKIRLISTVPYNLEAFADENMIRFVLRNLISNGIKFTQEGGRVVISAHKTETMMIEVCIADTGVGISHENLTSLFKIDKQFKMPGTAGEQGTGLGLIICQEFLSINGGHIRVESTPGQGTQFYFTLPLKKVS